MTTNTKLSEVYDESYSENYDKILNKVKDRESAKNLLGLVFRETGNSLPKKDNTKDSVRILFNQMLGKYGIS
jgi:hypothetical protein